MKQFIKTYGSVILNVCIVVNGFLGILGHFLFFKQFQQIFYISLHSDFWAMTLSSVVIYYEIRKIRTGKPLPRAVQVIRLVATAFTILVCIMFVGLQLSTAASRLGNGYITSMANICSHFVLPVFLIADALLFADFRDTKARDAFFGWIPYVIYVIFLVIAALCNVRFNKIKNTFMPYPVINPEINGWFTLGGGKVGVFYALVAITIISLALCCLVRLTVNYIRKKTDAAKKP